MATELNLNNEVEAASDLTTAPTGWTGRLAALLRAAFHSSVNPFGSAATRDTGTASGEVPVFPLAPERFPVASRTGEGIAPVVDGTHTAAGSTTTAVNMDGLNSMLDNLIGVPASDDDPEAGIHDVAGELTHPSLSDYGMVGIEVRWPSSSFVRFPIGTGPIHRVTILNRHYLTPDIWRNLDYGQLSCGPRQSQSSASSSPWIRPTYIDPLYYFTTSTSQINVRGISGRVVRPLSDLVTD